LTWLKAREGLGGWVYDGRDNFGHYATKHAFQITQLVIRQAMIGG